jgi:hypothetical protein
MWVERAIWAQAPPEDLTVAVMLGHSGVMRALVAARATFALAPRWNLASSWLVEVAVVVDSQVHSGPQAAASLQPQAARGKAVVAVAVEFLQEARLGHLMAVPMLLGGHLALADQVDLAGWRAAVAAVAAGMAAAAAGLTGMIAVLMAAVAVEGPLLQTRHLFRTLNIQLVFVSDMVAFD